MEDRPARRTLNCGFPHRASRRSGEAAGTLAVCPIAAKRRGMRREGRRNTSHLPGEEIRSFRMTASLRSSCLCVWILSAALGFNPADDTSRASRADSAPPAPAFSSHAYRAAWSRHPCARVSPALSGCPPRAPACGSRRNAAAHVASPACRAGPPPRPSGPPVETLSHAHDACAPAPSKDPAPAALGKR